MNYLTVEQVLFIHMRLLAETGGSPGVRDLGLLASAVSRPQPTFGGEDLHPDLFHKAAALLDSIIRNYPFVDGNKRVGTTATGLFLLRNGWRLTAANHELEAFTRAVAQSAVSFAQISAWLRFHTVSIAQA